MRQCQKGYSIIVKPKSKSPIPCPNRPQILTLSSDLSLKKNQPSPKNCVLEFIKLDLDLGSGLWTWDRGLLLGLGHNKFTVHKLYNFVLCHD